jgi:hypothetical protein
MRDRFDLNLAAKEDPVRRLLKKAQIQGARNPEE